MSGAATRPTPTDWGENPVLNTDMVTDDMRDELIRDFMNEFGVSEPTATMATGIFFTLASSMPEAQAERLRASLAAKYGDLKLNQVVDPAILGGLRVQIGDDVIDGSVASRLTELRLQLAG